MPGGHVTFNPERGQALSMIVGSPPERSGGVGGWVASERSRRRPAKWFKALPDDSMAWELLLDIDATPGPPIEDRLSILRDMGQPGGPNMDPPAIFLTGDVWEQDQRTGWVLEELSFGDRLYNGDGSLRRQAVRVALSRHVPVAEMDAIRIKPTRRPGGKPRRRQIKTRGNDTMRAVALRELGDATRWKDLQRWNKPLAKVNPDARLRTGTTLTIR